MPPPDVGLTWPHASPTAKKRSVTVATGGPIGRPPTTRPTGDPSSLFLIMSFCRKALRYPHPLSEAQRPMRAASFVVGTTHAKRPGAGPKCTSTFSGSSRKNGASTWAPDSIFFTGTMPALRAILALTPSAEMTTSALICSPSLTVRTQPSFSLLNSLAGELSLSSAPFFTASRVKALSKSFLSTTHAL